MTLSADELLAGGALTFEVEIPPEVLQPGVAPGQEGRARIVRLRPLTVRDLQLIARAAKQGDSLMAVLMVQRALVEPELTVPQVAALHVGLVRFLLQHVNRTSGISSTSEQLSVTAEDALVKASFVLSREFGWTPQQVGELTLGQILLHLQMLQASRGQ